MYIVFLFSIIATFFWERTFPLETYKLGIDIMLSLCVDFICTECKANLHTALQFLAKSNIHDFIP